MPTALFMYHLAGMWPDRGNAVLAHRYAFYNTYRTKDGRDISIGALEHRFWRNLCEHLGVSEYAPLQYDESRREEITAHLRTIFAGKTLAEWKTDLAGVDCCWAPVQTFDEALEDPFFVERQMVVETGDPDPKKARTNGVPAKLSDPPGGVRPIPSRRENRASPRSLCSASLPGSAPVWRKAGA